MGTQGKRTHKCTCTLDETGREAAITNIINSVACIENALCNILNAESEKINAVLGGGTHAEDMSYGGHSSDWNPCPNLDCALEVNDSVRKMVKSITILEVVLHSKLELFEDCLCPDDDDHCPHGHKK